MSLNQEVKSTLTSFIMKAIDHAPLRTIFKGFFFPEADHLHNHLVLFYHSALAVVSRHKVTFQRHFSHIMQFIAT